LILDMIHVYLVILVVRSALDHLKINALAATSQWVTYDIRTSVSKIVQVSTLRE
jgi:hypothetical protein